MDTSFKAFLQGTLGFESLSSRWIIAIAKYFFGVLNVSALIIHRIYQSLNFGPLNVVELRQPFLPTLDKNVCFQKPVSRRGYR